MDADFKIKSWRLAGLSAHKVVLSHPCDHDIPFILNIPAAGNKSP
jgi:hypothetical protein